MLSDNCTPYNEYTVGYPLLDDDSAKRSSVIVAQQRAYDDATLIGWLLVTKSGMKAFVPARSRRLAHPRSAPFVMLSHASFDRAAFLDVRRVLVRSWPEWDLDAPDGALTTRDCQPMRHAY